MLLPVWMSLSTTQMHVSVLYIAEDLFQVCQRSTTSKASKWEHRAVVQRRPAGTSKHSWRGWHSLLTPSTNHRPSCVSKVIGLMGNGTKCAPWAALVNAEMKFSQSSAGTWSNRPKTGPCVVPSQSRQTSFNKLKIEVNSGLRKTVKILI